MEHLKEWFLYIMAATELMTITVFNKYVPPGGRMLTIWGINLAALILKFGPVFQNASFILACIVSILTIPKLVIDWVKFFKNKKNGNI